MAHKFPDTWQLLPLEDCMDAIIDYRGKTPKKVSFGVPLVTAKVVKGGRILDEPREYIAFDEYDSWMRRGIPKPGDVVVTTEAPLGEIAQLDERKVALAQRLITLRGKPDLLDNDYLKFLMQSRFVQHGLEARATGTTVIGIRQKELRKVSLIIPPLPEQQVIARILGALDDKIELNHQMNHTLEAIARAIFKSWFVDFDPVWAKVDGEQPYGMDAETAALFPDAFVDSELGAIPEGWDVRHVGEIVKVVGGGTPSTKNPAYWDGGKHWFATPKDLSGLDSPILLRTERKVTDAGLARISSRLLPIGSVLLSSRAPVGYLAITEVPVCINQGFIAMICDCCVSNYYMLNWAAANMSVIKGRASGTTFAEISKKNFRPILVVTPPSGIVSAFNGMVKPLYDKIRQGLEESNVVAELRDTLLPKLVSGELRVSRIEQFMEEEV